MNSIVKLTFHMHKEGILLSILYNFFVLLSTNNGAMRVFEENCASFEAYFLPE